MADLKAITDAITRITSDQGLRDSLRTAGPNHAAGFTWAATARQHLSVYEKALSGAS